ncbi:class A beta-lactamase-related serine hydrolase [Rossellomorea aquimaris]|uniref:serine hydrolase n=1 Tax=Rossellomorea aquimaris TaxID=189382 RepID=UPI001CD25BF0|nr:serine hydrolase [Rossellomorea aquimaris]MCA1058945.1 class A beta-lactamase-related serine hydrolase [Rossellomorea aquimaris]
MRREEFGAFRRNIINLIPPDMTFGFYMHDMGTDFSVTINEDEWFPLASIAKWITAILVSGHDCSGVKEDVYFAIREHSNTAYSNLLQKLPDQHLNELLQELDIDCKVSSHNRDIVSNIGTPSGIYKMMEPLFHERLNPDDIESVLQGMKDQDDPDGFRFNDQWYHMTGGLEGVCNDVGFIEVDSRRIVVIGLLQSKDPTVQWTSLEKVMNRIGEVVMEYVEEIRSPNR